MVFLSLQFGGIDVLHAGSGNLLWRYTPRVPAPNLNPLIFVADGLVLVSTQDGHLSAMRASDGFTIWSAVLHPGEDLIPLNVADGVVYVGASISGSVDALRETSGSVIWRYPGTAEGTAPISVVQGVVYITIYPIDANSLATITTLRASDGTLQWNYAPHITYRQVLPVDGNDIVLIALEDGSVDALRASSGTLVWHRAINS
jgi:outer membrane protein assembly factor BamB